MDINFKTIEFELYGALLRTREILLTAEDCSAMLDKLDAGLMQIKSKKYNVAVVGEFRRGKSSLINALLGLPILPADVTPTTATINRITYGTEPEAIIYFKDGSTKKINDIAELSDYVTKITDEREATAKTVREAVVKFPIVICQNHVDIIDTPGLDDDEEMTAITIEMLNNIDAAVVAISALSPFSETERRFVTKLIAHKGITNIVFVVTFIDEIDDDDYERVFAGIKTRIRDMVREEVTALHAHDDWVMDKARRILDDMFIFGVSAKKALKSFAANDRKLLKQSRFAEFKEDLYAIITAYQSVNMVEKAVMAIQEAYDWLKANSAAGEKALESKQLEIKRLQVLAHEWLGFSHRKVNAMLATAYPELASALQISHQVEDETLRVFIKHLAQVKERSNKAVQTALMGAGLEAADYVRAKLADVAVKLSDIWNAQAAAYMTDFNAWLESAAAMELDSLNVDDLEALAQKLLQSHLHVMEMPSFTWAAPLWPNVPDLLDINVIEHVRATLGQSLRATDAALAEQARLWRKGLFAAAFAMEKELLPLMTEALNEAEEYLVIEERFACDRLRGQLDTLAQLVAQSQKLLLNFRDEPETVKEGAAHDHV